MGFTLLILHHLAGERLKPMVDFLQPLVEPLEPSQRLLDDVSRPVDFLQPIVETLEPAGKLPRPHYYDGPNAGDRGYPDGAVLQELRSSSDSHDNSCESGDPDRGTMQKRGK